MSDQALIYARIVVVLAALATVIYVLVSGQPQPLPTIAAIVAAAGGLVAVLTGQQIKAQNEQTQVLITRLGAQVLRSANLEQMQKRE